MITGDRSSSALPSVFLVLPSIFFFSRLGVPSRKSDKIFFQSREPRISLDRLPWQGLREFYTLQRKLKADRRSASPLQRVYVVNVYWSSSSVRTCLEGNAFLWRDSACHGFTLDPLRGSKKLVLHNFVGRQYGVSHLLSAK